MAARWHSKAVAQFFYEEISEKLPQGTKSRAYREKPPTTAQKTFWKSKEFQQQERKKFHVTDFITQGEYLLIGKIPKKNVVKTLYR